MNRCVFLDRDGVLNEDDPDYTYALEKFRILPGVLQALKRLNDMGYLLVVVTNQGGISKGIYTIAQMKACHEYLQQQSGGLIDAFYFSPYNKTITESLLTKPGSLMFEKAIAKFGIDVTQSWMVGDRGRDLTPARKLGIRTIQIGDEFPEPASRGDYRVEDLAEAADLILK